MERVPLDLDRLALVIGRLTIEKIALEQQLEAAHAPVPEPSAPLENEHAYSR